MEGLVLEISDDDSLIGQEEEGTISESPMHMGLDSVMLDSFRVIFLSILTARTALAISDCGAE